MEEDLQTAMEEFLRQFYEKDLLAAAKEEKKSLTVDFALLDKFNPDIADKLLNSPEIVFEAAGKAIESIDLPEYSVKHVRFKNLPEQQNIRIRSLRSEHIGKFVCIEGVVRRASEVKPEVSLAVFECPDCGSQIKVEQKERFLKPPAACECGRKSGFRLTDRNLFDARWIVIEEPFETATGERPGEVSIYLKEDLTTPEMQRKADPGNRLKINGVVKEIRKIIKGRMRTQMDIFIEANYMEPTEIEWEEVEINKEDEKKIKELAADPEVYKKIVSSIAPSIYGMNEVKEAIMLQLFGGVLHNLPDRTRVRGDVHVLLLGDPSCLIADERVVMADGTIMKIGEMGSEHLQDINYNVHMGMGRNSGKAIKFHFYKQQPIIEIVTETGKSIKGTHNQPVLILKDGCRLWKRLDEVKLGERIQILPRIECKKKTLVKTNWVDYPYYHKSWHIKIPKFVDEELASIFGYIIADGWVQKSKIGFVINKDEMYILPKITDAFEKCFGVSLSAYDHKRASDKINYYEINRTHLAKLLSFLNEKRVPNLIWQSRDSVVASFLRWLYEGDGCVFCKGRGRTSISLKSTNIELLRDVQILLLRFDIHSRILWEKEGRPVEIKGRKIVSTSSGSLMIRRSESIIKFSQNIGFASQKKRTKLEQAAQYAKSHIHRVHKTRNEKIVTINRLPPQDVFDVEVPKFHRFVANGIIVHNTAKSQLLKLISQIIPRGKYVAGRGTTAAGLTATVLKDEEFMGGWVLEAGAMVLCNKGILAVDEFDKMSKEDQIAMHEALEQQSYHPNTEIILADGLKYRIGEFVDELMKRNADKIIKGKDCEMLPVGDISILTTDFKKVYPAKVKRVSRHIAPKEFVKITYSNGRCILVTPEHPVWILDDFTVKTLPAELIKPEMFAPAPKKLPKEASRDNLKRVEKVHFNENDILQPQNMNKGLGKILGYYVSEGHNFIGKRCKEIGFTNSDDFILSDTRSLMSNSFGINPYIQERHSHVFVDRYSSTQLYRFFHTNFPEVLQKSRMKNIPNMLLRCSDDIVKSFLSAAYLGDGFVDTERFGFSTTSLDLAKGYQELLLTLGIYSYIAEDMTQKSYKVIVSGTNSMKMFLDLVDEHDSRKRRIEWLVRRSKNINRQRGDFPYTLGKEIKNILSVLKIDDGYFCEILKSQYGITEQTIRKYIEKIRKKIYEMKKSLVSNKGIIDVRKTCKISQMDIQNRYGIKHQTVSYIERRKGHKRTQELLSYAESIAEERIKMAETICKKIENLINTDIRWIQIKSVERIKNDSCKWVYDVTVEPTRCFISECLVLHNTVSIAKASIVATLPAQVSVLAGANPKFSRFDPYRPIAEQIDIPDTLLSRFDLKFALRDIPDKEKDELLATHILETRLAPESVKPLISPEFLRKYVAYARKNCQPVMTRGAAERLKQFYVDMRGLYAGEETVAITLRQNEALMRLAESSAKIQLRNEVSKEDANRAIAIMKYSLQQLGYDYETGRIDIDRTEGVSSSQRSKIRILMDIIDRLERELGKQIPKEDVLAAAEEEGLRDVEDLLQKLKREGMLFEPKLNTVQKT